MTLSHSLSYTRRIVDTPTQPTAAAHQDEAAAYTVADVQASSSALDAAATVPPLALSPDNPPWGVAAGIGVWLASVALLVLIQSFAVVPYALSQGVNGATLAKFLSEDRAAILISIAAVFPAHLLTLALVWAVATRFGKFSFAETLGMNWSEHVGFWTSAGLAVGLLGLGVLITSLFGEQETALEQMLNSSRAARYTIAALATLTAPLVEELVYRGVLYSALQRRTGQAWAIAGVLALFTIIHVPQYYPNLGVIVTIGILSLALTLLRARTGKLLPCIVLHLIFNGIQSLFIVFGPLKDVQTETQQQAPGFLLQTLTHGWQLIS